MWAGSALCAVGFVLPDPAPLWRRRASWAPRIRPHNRPDRARCCRGRCPACPGAPRVGCPLRGSAAAPFPSALLWRCPEGSQCRCGSRSGASWLCPPRPSPPPTPRLQMEASSGGQSRGGSGLVGRNKSARIAPTAPRQRCPRPRAASGAARIWAAFPVPPPSRASVSRPDPPAERRGSEGSAARSRAWRGHAGTRLRSAAAPRSPPRGRELPGNAGWRRSANKAAAGAPPQPPPYPRAFPTPELGGGEGGRRGMRAA